MRPYTFFIIICFSIFLKPQEINNSYLESLPDDIRADLIDRSKNSNQEIPTYRSNQFSSKLQKDEELSELKKRLENDLYELERRMEGLKIEDDNEQYLKLFGSEFFNTIQSSFMPINEPNSDSAYLLGNGDLLEIQFVGQKNILNTFLISRDGSINIPDIGRLNLSGLNLDQAVSLIKASVNKTYVGTEAYVTLKNIRDVNVLVSGNALNPGVYTLSGYSNMFHAISAAGGINEYGSYRKINLIRDSKIIETMDVYDLLITGNYKLNKRLRSGDIIFVDAIKNVVTIDGAVKRPAKYEVLDSENLYDVVDFANGTTVFADMTSIYLDRVMDGDLKSLPITSLNQFKSIKVQDGDMIYIRKFPYRTVTIQGAVLKPGSYMVNDNKSLKDLIKLAGGYTNNAYPAGLVYENKKALKVNKMAKQVLYDQFLDNIITISQQNPGSNLDFSSIIQLTQELNQAAPNGRIVIDLIGDEGDSIIIKDGDKITIPEMTNQVYVYGEVSSEGAVPFTVMEDLEYYISLSGGYKDYADKSAIYILHPNGSTEKFSNNRNLFANEPVEIILKPGSVIFVPRKLDNSAVRRLSAQAYVSILGNIGVALASLSAINNN